MAVVPEGPTKYEKSYFNLLGIYCPSKVPLVEKLLGLLAGVQKVTIAVPSRTVVVVDTISQSQISEDLS